MCVTDACIIYIARLLHLLPVRLALLLMLLRKMRKKFVTLMFVTLILNGKRNCMGTSNAKKMDLNCVF